MKLPRLKINDELCRCSTNGLYQVYLTRAHLYHLPTLHTLAHFVSASSVKKNRHSSVIFQHMDHEPRSFISEVLKPQMVVRHLQSPRRSCSALEAVVLLALAERTASRPLLSLYFRLHRPTVPAFLRCPPCLSTHEAFA